MRAFVLVSSTEPGPHCSFGDVGGCDSLFEGSQDGALPLLSKMGGGTVTLSAPFLELGREGVTDFATGGPAARSSPTTLLCPWSDAA